MHGKSVVYYIDTLAALNDDSLYIRALSCSVEL
jgi:hypothetical protein